MTQQLINTTDSTNTTVAKENANFTELYLGIDSIGTAYVRTVSGKSGDVQLVVADITGAASIGYVNQSVATQVSQQVAIATATILGVPPATLDTLQKIANAINNDPAFASSMDAAISAKVPFSGGTMLGPLYASRDPVLGHEVATKSYVDGRIVVHPNATTTSVGTVQVGANLTIDINGVLAANVSLSDINALSVSIVNGLALKADAATTYSKLTVDSLVGVRALSSDLNAAVAALLDIIAKKSDILTTYSKNEVDNLLSGITAADEIDDAIDITSINGVLATKADKSDTYTKAQIDTTVSTLATEDALNASVAALLDLINSHSVITSDPTTGANILKYKSASPATYFLISHPFGSSEVNTQVLVQSDTGSWTNDWVHIENLNTSSIAVNLTEARNIIATVSYIPG